MPEFKLAGGLAAVGGGGSPALRESDRVGLVRSLGPGDDLQLVGRGRDADPGAHGWNRRVQAAWDDLHRRVDAMSATVVTADGWMEASVRRAVARAGQRPAASRIATISS